MTGNTDGSEGLTSYYRQKIEHLELTVRDKTMNLRRLQAQRNELNSKGTHELADVAILIMDSSSVARRIAIVARTRFLCGGSRETNGQIQSLGESQPRRQIRCGCRQSH